MKNELTTNYRSAIMDAENFLKEVAKENSVDLEPVHHFAKGLYGRELFIPAGTIATGMIHTSEHLCVVIGDIIVSSEDSPEGKHFTGVNIFKTDPGIKRIVRTITDTYFITFHATKASRSTNINMIERQLTAETYDEFDKKQLKRAKRNELGGPK